MATVTSVKSGNWSDPSVWDTSSVPADGDTVVIASGHTVIFDVDQSGWANGLAGLTIDGTLKWATDGTVTYLKMAGNITGSGAMYVGEENDPIPPPAGTTPEVATIAFNGAYQITGALSALELWGEEREPSYEIASKTDDTHIVLAGSGSLSWLRAGDVIGVSDSTHRGTGYATTHTVAAYDPATRTITLDASTPLTRAVNQNGTTDRVILLSRNILVTNLVKATDIGFINSVDGGVAYGVRFYNFYRGALDNRSDWRVAYCTAQNVTNGGIAYSGSGHTITSCTAQNVTYGGIALYGSGHTITSCTAQNVTNGGIAREGSGHTITSCTGASGANQDLYYAQNMTHGSLISKAVSENWRTVGYRYRVRGPTGSRFVVAGLREVLDGAGDDGARGSR